MRVLVTGHKGYIGSVMVPMLLKEGHDVVGLDSDLYVRCNFGEFDDAVPNIKKDIRDVELSDLEGFDAIIHLAGLSNDPLGDLDPELTFGINYLASVNLAKLAKKAGVKRFVFSSSCSNYGASGDNIIDENAEFKPVTIYGRSKVLVEKDVSKLADSKFCPTFLRNATAYGVSPRLRFDLVLNNLVAWAFTTGHVHIKSDGSPWRPIVHIEDISSAFIAVLNSPEELVNNKAFNVGATEENYQIREIAKIVKDTVPGSKIEFAKNAGPDKRCYRVNCDEVLKLTGFKPKWNATLGAKQLYKTYKNIGLELEDFEGPRYKRIDHIRQLLATGELDPTLRWSQSVKTQKAEALG
ncbi:MAG: NAD-dependent epimerase/dehydratase family protein [Thermodesulfobacteriota bacterium]